MSYQSDKYYIEQVANGNRNAFSSIVEKYQDNVYSLALKICHNNEDAEEVAQDSFLKAFRSLDSFKQKSSLSTWIYRITYNTAITSIRNKKRKPLSLEDFPADAVDFLRDNDSEERAENEYKRTLLNFAMQKLSADDRAVISLYYFQDLSFDEIVAIVDISKSNLKVRLHRARKKMEEIINTDINKNQVEYEKVTTY